MEISIVPSCLKTESYIKEVTTSPFHHATLSCPSRSKPTGLLKHIYSLTLLLFSGSGGSLLQNLLLVSINRLRPLPVKKLREKTSEENSMLTALGCNSPVLSVVGDGNCPANSWVVILGGKET